MHVCVAIAAARRWLGRAEREARRREQVDVVREAPGGARALAVRGRRHARAAVRRRAHDALLARLVAPPPQPQAAAPPEGARARALAPALAPQAQPDQSGRDRRPQAPTQQAATAAEAAGDRVRNARQQRGDEAGERLYGFGFGTALGEPEQSGGACESEGIHRCKRKFANL